ncbi:MAG: 50S ribosomal protein L9 [Lachnospiraceae bacterium]|nr:50S ribosomal protein L9 [Lachnospiraceae bacterium]MBR6528106.1 50S ribosomal protein L9 [Lachnospiraceae bacterium]
MKVVLLQDVKALGKKGDVVEVKEGYAKNMLLPKKLGIEATPKALNDLKLQKANADKKAAEALAAAKELAAKLESVPVKVAVKMGAGGKVFGSVSTKEIAEAIQKEMGLEVDKKKISADGAIKDAGTYTVNVKLHPEVTAKVKVLVAAL